GEDARDAREAGRRAVRPEAEAGPPLLERVARRQEQHGLRGAAAGDQEEPRVLGLELREVEERVALAEVVVLEVVALELALVGSGHQHDPAADAGQQRAPPGGYARRVDGAAHARQLRHWRPGAERRRGARAPLRGERGHDDASNEDEHSHGLRSYRARARAAT